MKNNNNNTKQNMLSPKQAAKILMVSPITIRQWAQKGKIKAYTTIGGHRRFKLEDIEEFIHNRDAKSSDKNILKILIIDDDVNILTMLSNIFRTVTKKKIEIDTANNGFEGGLKVHSFKPDILLLDLKMHGIDGFEVCKQVKQNPKTAHIRIITMTGNTSQNKIDKIVKLGAEACIEKPIEIKALLHYLRL